MRIRTEGRSPRHDQKELLSPGFAVIYGPAEPDWISVTDDYVDPGRRLRVLISGGYCANHTSLGWRAREGHSARAGSDMQLRMHCRALLPVPVSPATPGPSYGKPAVSLADAPVQGRVGAKVPKLKEAKSRARNAIRLPQHSTQTSSSVAES